VTYAVLPFDDAHIRLSTAATASAEKVSGHFHLPPTSTAAAVTVCRWAAAIAQKANNDEQDQKKNQHFH
jgi:hypothetical protein